MKLFSMLTYYTGLLTFLTAPDKVEQAREVKGTAGQEEKEAERRVEKVEVLAREGKEGREGRSRAISLMGPQSKPTAERPGLVVMVAHQEAENRLEDLQSRSLRLHLHHLRRSRSLDNLSLANHRQASHNLVSHNRDSHSLESHSQANLVLEEDRLALSETLKNVNAYYHDGR